MLPDLPGQEPAHPGDDWAWGELQVADKDDDFRFRTVKWKDDNEVEGWYWLPGSVNDDLLIGPFDTEAEAIEDAKQTLAGRAIRDGKRTLQ